MEFWIYGSRSDNALSAATLSVFPNMDDLSLEYLNFILMHGLIKSNARYYENLSSKRKNSDAESWGGIYIGTYETDYLYLSVIKLILTTSWRFLITHRIKVLYLLRFTILWPWKHWKFENRPSAMPMYQDLTSLVAIKIFINAIETRKISCRWICIIQKTKLY